MEKYIEDNLGLVRWVLMRRYKEYVKMGLYDDLFQAGVIGLIEAHNRFREDKCTKFSTYAYYWVCQCIQYEVYKYYRPKEVLVDDNFQFDVGAKETSDLEKNEIRDDILVLLGDELLKCSERDREIVRSRFGIEGEAQTLREIAGKYGLSKMRISQIVRGVIRRIKARISVKDFKKL